jgi:hypothetical protein
MGKYLHRRAAGRALAATILGSIAAAHPQLSMATTIAVATGGGVISFTGGPASSAYKIYQHPPNSFKTGASFSGTTNASGDSGANHNITGLNGTFEIDIGGENYVGIVNGGNYTSIQEQNKAAPGFFSGLFSVLGSSFSTISVLNGVTTDQFNLVNSSTLYPYVFTSLLVYKDLNMSFFTQSQFDSAAAIASGTFVEDLVADSGGVGIPVAGGGDIPEISIPVAGLSPDGYQLVFGVAEPYLGNGEFGSPFDFALASTTAPEASTWAMMIIGFAGLGFAGYRRAKLNQTAPIV